MNCGWWDLHTKYPPCDSCTLSSDFQLKSRDGILAPHSYGMRDVSYPFSHLGIEGYNSNQDVPFNSVMFNITFPMESTTTNGPSQDPM